MTGQELKKVIEMTGLGKSKIANAMGISMQALAQYYKTVDMRQETIDKLNDAIRKLTNDEKSLSDYTGYKTKEMGGATSTPPIGTSDQQMDALGFAAGQIGKMTTSLIIALDRINKREAELEERINRVSRLEEIIDRRLKALSKYIDADKLPFGGIGNISIPDMAADDAPDPDQSNDVKHNGKRGGGK